MSLFQSKVWWTTKVAAQEEFDAGHLAVGSFGTKESSQRVVVGSFDGKLRIYEPREGGFKPSHLIMEKDEEKPVIQLCNFRFREDTGTELLAVLYPKGFSLYSFHVGQEGLNLKMEAKDEGDRLCANMTAGFVGGDGILCIQSQEGFLQFYGGSSARRQCTFQLPDVVLPSPMLFLRKGIIVSQDSCYKLSGYRYGNIFSATGGSGTTVKPEWETFLGEPLLSADCSETSDDCLIIAGCEQHIYVIKANGGKVDTLKRLQCVPAAVLLSGYRQDPKDLVLIVASFSHHMLFYKNFELAWASKTTNVGIGVKIGTFANKKGMLCSLNDEGHLDVFFMGVDVPELQFSGAATRDISYEDLKKESNSLRNTLAERAADEEKSGNSKVPPLSLKCSVILKNTSEDVNNENVFASEMGTMVSSKLNIAVSMNTSEATNVFIQIRCPEALQFKDKTFSIDSVKPGGSSTPTSVETNFYLDNRMPITSNTFHVSAIYQVLAPGGSQTGSATTTIKLPLQAFCYLVAPIKEADFKLTLECSDKLPSLPELFSDFLEATKPDPSYYSNPMVLSFLLSEGSNCTLILAKSQNKLRVQGNRFDSLYILLNELMSRASRTNSALSFSYTDALPMKDFFDILDERKSIANTYEKLSNQMAEGTDQLLMIQKRLISRYKDKSPAPLNNLDVLLESSINELNSQSKESQRLQQLFRENSQRAAVALQMFMLLLRLRFPISADGAKLLQQYVPNEVENTVQQIGWIEHTDLNIRYLLKCVLMGKEDPSIQSYSQITDMSVFQQHFTLLVDKISKGLLANYQLPKEARN